MVTGDRSYDTGKYFLSITDDADEQVQTACGDWDQMVTLGKSIRPLVEKVTLIHVGEYCFTYRDIAADGTIGAHYH